MQFLYGEDGMDGVSVESQALEALRLGNREVEQKYRWKPDSPKFGEFILEHDIIEDIKNSGDKRSILENEFQQILADRKILREKIILSGEEEWPLPVNLHRLIWNAQKIFHLDLRKPTDLHPVKVVEGIKSLCERLIIIPGDDEITKEAQRNSTLLFNILLRFTLASKKVIKDYRLDNLSFDWILGEIEDRFYRYFFYLSLYLLFGLT